MVFWLIGLSGSGKTTFAKEVVAQLKPKYPNTVLIDGDLIREVFRHDSPQAYTLEERKKNADRISELCLMLDKQGIHVVCSILSAFESSREWNRKNYSQYFETYIKVPMDVLKRREIKGLYASGAKNVVGLDLPFEEPMKPDLVIENSNDLSSFAPVASEIIKKAFAKYGL